MFNSIDLTGTISEGMRLRTTRTVAAPDQCADLESGSSHYFSKSSPTSLGLATTVTAMGWVKLESYVANGTIVSNFSGTGFLLRLDAGRVIIYGDDAGTADQVISYQAVPLGRWVHVAASMTINSGGNVYIDGVEVPAVYTNGTTTSILEAGDVTIGGYTGGAQLFDGKIAQVGVFDAILTADTIRSYASQGLAGNETNCVGAWSLDNDITDLNANANDLTAQGGAAATDTDSPFGNKAVSTTLDYGIVTAATFSTNTTLTVQVPEGCTIPTSGGVSAVAYSTNSVPYGFVRDSGRWVIEAINNNQGRKTTPVTGTWYNIAGSNTLGFSFTIPVGAWDAGYSCMVQQNGTAGAGDLYATLSTGAATENDEYFTLSTSGNAAAIAASLTKKRSLNLTAATEYFLNAKAVTLLGSPSLYVRGDTSPTIIYAECAYL